MRAVLAFGLVLAACSVAAQDLPIRRAPALPQRVPAVPRPKPNVVAFLARDDPEPVMLQFMQPAVAARDAIGEDRLAARDEARRHATAPSRDRGTHQHRLNLCTLRDFRSLCDTPFRRDVEAHQPDVHGLRQRCPASAVASEVVARHCRCVGRVDLSLHLLSYAVIRNAPQHPSSIVPH